MIDKNLTGWRLHRNIALFLKASLIIGAVLALYQGRIQVAVETVLILLVTFLPLLLGDRFQVKIPAEFELLAIIFVYASLFLGEVHNFYALYWWWDLVLHTSAGLLLGILGFLLIYVLNEKKKVHMNLTPGFMGLFAFTFAMAFGGLWEIFEFAMDQAFDLTMQKPTITDPSGLTDTMWDLIVDGIGALIIAVLGYSYLHTSVHDSFLEHLINEFIRKNPRLFVKKGR